MHSTPQQAPTGQVTSITTPDPSRSLVSIFGSAGPQPATPRYIEAMDLGRGIAELGLDVLTGGYGGTMEAASRGANEAGGVVVGATCDAIESFRPGTEVNAWVTKELRTATLLERLGLVTSTCHAAVILPGGVGTLLELALLWNSTMIAELVPVPILAVGDVWRDLLALLNNPEFIAPAHLAMVEHCPDIATAIARLGELLPVEPSLQA
ncbi:MAG: hypothetical protein ACI9C2_001124 [Gammaproteobacteria bacterium]|jgi:uncharacterized protein (TIGR00725 family)